LIPPGWTSTASANLRTIQTNQILSADNVGFKSALSANTQYAAIRTQLNNSLGTFTSEIEEKDVVDRLTAMIAFITQLQVVFPLTDPHAIADALKPLKPMYSAYATSHSDQTFNATINALIDSLSVSIAPADFLTSTSALALFVGYMSTHMNLMTNPTGYSFVVYLLAGPGVFMRINHT
jgi:hypothetical protein